MTSPADLKFLPGERAPYTSAYHERDPWTWRVVRRLLLPRGDAFPAASKEGGFYTRRDASAEPRAVRSTRWA